MTQTTAPGLATPLRPLSYAVRIGVGLLSGIGATGVAAGLGVIGALVDIHVPVISADGLLLIAPVAAIPFAAGALLRGAAAVVATTAGAVAAPVGAAFLIDGSCHANGWVGFGLLMSAVYAFVIAGAAAFVGDRVGGPQTFTRKPGRWTWGLIGLGLLGLIGWTAFLSRMACA